MLLSGGDCDIIFSRQYVFQRCSFSLCCQSGLAITIGALREKNEKHKNELPVAATLPGVRFCHVFCSGGVFSKLVFDFLLEIRILQFGSAYDIIWDR